MKLKPVGNRVVVSLIEEELPTQNGIILPNSVKGPVNQGKVLAVGGCDNLIDSALKVGDVTYFLENAGASLKIENEDYLIIDVKDILAIDEDKH
ncbi:co-chaperone GroES [Fictibacillus sp. WQ 8-8]|uniref:co-chaperone GroES n=1 Tax=Fictibacillus sp. WQ 8-8 TaxID=2938788 RepID=UPI00210AAE3C|nr:co-chaperone GroES [Fictibacillus sp. WQ 8-8]MCQ6267783.1 co-chaperone GroES [Fictibacillus sp. WQ 8-8]